MHIKCRYFSRKNLATGGVEPPPQMPLTVKELDYTPLHLDANLKFNLQHNDEVYQKNVNIGEQISILLESGNVREKSLSKQNKFCLDLYRAQRPTTDVENAELRLWQDQLLHRRQSNGRSENYLGNWTRG